MVEYITEKVPCLTLARISKRFTPNQEPLYDFIEDALTNLGTAFSFDVLPCISFEIGPVQWRKGQS
eukprot:scaffold1504_cov172-Ochromonas_danica.AAC.3